VLRGPVVETLASLFEDRWRMSGGGVLKLPRPEPREHEAVRLEVAASLPLPGGPVALSRTFGKTLVPPREAVREVRALYLDAIAAAEHFLYLENQYFSSRAIFLGLVRRMREVERPRLHIVLVLPEEPEALREQLAMGLAQARLLRALRRVAHETGHHLGLYRTVARGPYGEEVPTYIHSKLMVVDDRFLTLGSANTTNRSMGLDSELNLAWESTAPGTDGLRRAIRRLRVSLLMEHSGLEGLAAVRELARADGLVPFLDRVAAEGRHRLRPHLLESLTDRTPLLKEVLPADLLIDPEDSVLDESLFESMKDERGLVASGVRRLTRWLVGHIEPEPTEAP
jgi:phospholipase D1/2